MMTLITGGSGSGKSSYGESYVERMPKEWNRYYLATMEVFDPEGEERVRRHQRMRKGKGFLTIEQPRQIEGALAAMNLEETRPSCALLECISNLTANEMFTKEAVMEEKQVVSRILKGIEELEEHLKRLVIVTNNVFEDGICYDAATMAYLRAMGSINEALAKRADQVIEVVAGIPVLWKGER